MNWTDAVRIDYRDRDRRGRRASSIHPFRASWGAILIGGLAMAAVTLALVTGWPR